MPRILVPPEVLIRVSEEAARAAEELETTKNRLDQQITYMMSSWEGTTRSRFFEDFQRAHGEMNKTIEHLRIIGQELKAIAFRFISADMHEDLMMAASAASAANEPKTFWDHAGDFWQGLQTGAKSVANSVKDTATSLVEDPLGTAKDMAYNATIGTAEEIIDTAVWGGKMIFDADTREKFAADVEASGGASNYMGQQAAMILAGLATRRIGVKTHPHLKHDSGGDGGKVEGSGNGGIPKGFEKLAKSANDISKKAKEGKIKYASNYHGRLGKEKELEILSNPDAVYVAGNNSQNYIYRKGGNVVIVESKGSSKGNTITSYGPDGARGESGAAIFGGKATEPGMPVTNEAIVNGTIPTPGGGTLPPATQILP
ncbi:WXG100 family type VII secretion target [Paenibacillus lautus]|uniref:WXG100 family type VII secretion target n=1 Tax=Paenibacillus lautus TaxID=1401 RepID=UPI002041329D|nr:WXG100 family type VII secretion target [Paenibacillus lautus]MCM3260623.1 WXG100 family type VII secretion target [Paenibacillus lautus]